MRAGLVAVISTNRCGDSLPVVTPPVKTSGSRVSTPGSPFGMRVKESRPIVFWFS